jgi:hypothetical protein
MSAYIKKSKISNQESNTTAQTPRKTRTINPNTSRRREIIEIRAEINEIETTTKKYKELMKQKLILRKNE